MTDSTAELGVELERLALRALSQTWSNLNATFFGHRLRPPSFALSDSTQRLGRWVSAERTIELSRGLLLSHGWGVVVEVLKHETAHQFVDEVLQCRDEVAHGVSFRRVCAERGFDARAAGTPRDGSAPEDATARVLERVAKLLALAGSPNQHEAQAAMNAAQRLMLKHNLDVVRSGAQRGFEFKHLGEPTGRVGEPARLLASILGEFFFVEVIWVPVWRPLEGRPGTVLEVCGTRENVALAAYVHDFLLHTSERLWREHKCSAGLTGDTDRRAFLAGVMAGFRDKLQRERRHKQTEGLVWVGDPQLDGFFRGRHPHTRTRRHAGSAHNPAHADGRAAGRDIVLRRGIDAAPSGERRLLGSKR